MVVNIRNVLGKNTWLNQILGILFCLITPCTFFFPRCSAWGLAVIGLMGWVEYPQSCYAYLKNPLCLSLLALCAWFTLSGLWSVTPSVTYFTSIASTMLIFLGVGFGSLIQDICDLPRFKKIFLISLCLTCALIIGETLLHHPFLAWKHSGSARSFTPVALLLCLNLPLIFVTFASEQIRVIMYVLIILALRQIDNDTAQTSAVLIILALYIPKILFSKIRKFGLIVVMGLGLTLPFIMNLSLTPEVITTLNQNVFHDFSYAHRLYIWKVVSEKIMQSPWVGYGFNTSRSHELGGKQMTMKHYTAKGTVVERKGNVIPLHPHNLFLQIWLEGGLVAIIGFMFIFYRIFSRIHDVPSLVFVGVSLFVMSVNVGAWQSWWLASVIMWGWFVNRLCTQKNHTAP